MNPKFRVHVDGQSIPYVDERAETPDAAQKKVRQYFKELGLGAVVIKKTKLVKEDV